MPSTLGVRSLFAVGDCPCIVGYLAASWVSYRPSLGAQLVRNLPAMQETPVQLLGWEDPLEEGTAPHSSILAWRIPRTVQSVGLQGVGHD